ncbi:hypothetical protein F2P81_023870 [Scophthalmus maximus]|uniref:Uncharacterized protein n=1 Tax=Scophthalmus maximus TaxID=52904 RepID=A0A6A4RV43_SCOMX|nr:hypothetical protein F2P81_023870 [Scophthalmus maximus]
MSQDKVHLARFVLDALDGEIVDSETEGAQTPLISSVLLPDGQTRCKFAELLLQRGASVNCQDGSGRTALTYACEKGFLDAVKTLVRNNADPEIVDCWGNTALMYAAVAGHSHVVEFLVRAFKRLGLQINRQNKVGNSAVEVAKFLGHTECISALSSKKGSAQPRLGARCGDVNDRLEIQVGHLVNELELLQTCNHADCSLVQNCAWQPRPRMRPSRLTSMDSIEEFDRESDGSSAPPQELLFSGVLTPRPPPRSSDHSPTCDRLTTPDDHLPPLLRSSEAQKSIFFSPRPNRNTHRPRAPCALGILLTPIVTNTSERGSETQKSNTLDFGLRRFHDSYYQKRFSLPTSVLSPTPPERALALRNSRTVRRREASPCRAEPLRCIAPATTFSALSNKLLRRFTSPEFKKDVKELQEEPVLPSGRIPRSETFPQCTRHPQVDSKPSIDSISSVKCEFDFPFRVPNS